MPQQTADPDWPAPSATDSAEIKQAWATRPRARAKDPEFVRRAWDAMILKHLRSEEEEKREAQRQADGQASNMYYIISSFRNI